jgi:hypothetical protein
MKKYLFWTAALVMAIFLSKYASETSKDLVQSGGTMELRSQKVVGCASGKIMLESKSGPGTMLEIDNSWPDCSTFMSDEYYDFLLGRGEKMKYISAEKLPWWRVSL